MSLTYQVQNPVTNEVVETFDTATDETIEQVLSAAHDAFPSWRDRDIAERAEIVGKAAELFREKRKELGEIIALEMGKPLNEAIGEVKFSADILDYYATHGPELAKDQPLEHKSPGDAVIRKRPLGPLLGIMPWNYPYYQVARFAGPNLVLGNTIILKHAEICPRSSQAIQDIFDEAGVPEGVYTNVYASHDQISTIIADRRVQGVSLTGSERAGAAVAEQAGKHLKKCVLELGGNDPYVILDTSDVAQAAKDAWAVRIENTGQACNSNKRMIVMDDIYDDFVAELVKLATPLKRGNPLEPSDDTYSPLSSRDAAERLHKQVTAAVDAGATLHVGGEIDDSTAYFSPAVITDIPVGSEPYYEEFFGPTAVVYKVSSEEEAIELANDNLFGLGGSVHSEHEGRAERLALLIESGMTHANAPSAETEDLPFGGIKRSGYGRELGHLALDEFCNKQLYYVDTPAK